MKLNNQYLIYEEYQKLGGIIDRQTFQLLEYRAEKEVDRQTFNRFRKIKEYPIELKMCIFDLITHINNIYSGDSSVISETIGNYSITRKNKEELNKESVSLIANYLQNTKVNNIPVLYRGADINDN